jgi:predicted ATPase
VISVIRILTHLFEENTTALIIDEPELSLHPLAQKRLIKLIAEYSQSRQIIISTHSPYFVSWDYITNGAVLNRVAKVDDTSSKVYSLKESANYASLISAPIRLRREGVQQLQIGFNNGERPWFQESQCDSR